MARTKQVPTKMPAKPLLMKKSSKKKAAEPEAGGVKKTKAPRRFKPGTVAVRDIRKAQRHGNRGIPKSVIDSLVREIATNFTASDKDMRFKKSALRAIHEAAESFQTDVMRLAGTLSLHAKRKTLDVASMKLASTLVLCPHVFHETEGTAKAMKGCLRNQTKILWDAPAFPKDADDDKMTDKADAKAATKAAAKVVETEKKAVKAAKKAAKVSESQKKAEAAADNEMAEYETADDETADVMATDGAAAEIESASDDEPST